MDLAQLLTDVMPPSGRAFALPDAEQFCSRLSVVEPLPSDPPAEDVVVISRAEAGAEEAGLGRLAEVLGQGTGVLLMEVGLAEIPVGALLQALSAAGLRALMVGSLRSGGVGSVLVASRDPELPLRSHLLGEAFTLTSPQAAQRRDNEFLIESVVSRARTEAAEVAWRAELAALREAEGALTARVADLEAQVQRHRDEAARAREKAERADGERERLERAVSVIERRSPGYRAARLVSRARQDPGGVGRDIVGRLKGSR